MNEAETICQHVRPDLRPRATELAENILFMESKLRETRNGIARSQVVIDYDNGGGQKGIRRNPAFDGYNALLRSYCTALSQLEHMLGEDAPAEARPMLDRFKVVRGLKVVGDD